MDIAGSTYAHFPFVFSASREPGDQIQPLCTTGFWLRKGRTDPWLEGLEQCSLMLLLYVPESPAFCASGLRVHMSTFVFPPKQFESQLWGLRWIQTLQDLTLAPWSVTEVASFLRGRNRGLCLIRLNYDPTMNPKGGPWQSRSLLLMHIHCKSSLEFLTWWWRSRARSTWHSSRPLPLWGLQTLLGQWRSLQVKYVYPSLAQWGTLEKTEPWVLQVSQGSSCQGWEGKIWPLPLVQTSE